MGTFDLVLASLEVDDRRIGMVVIIGELVVGKLFWITKEVKGKIAFGI